MAKHGKNPCGIAAVYSLTGRRVQQLVKEYKETKKSPALSDRRRPKTGLFLEQEKNIEDAHQETKLNPRMLFHELKRRGEYAPKNKILQGQHEFVRKAAPV